MNRHAAGNAIFGLTKEPVMGIINWIVRGGTEGKGWLYRLVVPAGRPDPKTDAIKRAAEEDVAAMEAEDRKYFRQDGPGRIEDDL